MKIEMSISGKKTKGNRDVVLTTIVVALLLILWIPVVLDKLLSFHDFRFGIHHQPLPIWLKQPLVYALPILEITTVSLLIIDYTRRWGMWLSFLLMLTFTGYVGYALLGGFEKIPCGCGSVISGLSWQGHFWFNLSFTLISVYGIYLTTKKRGNASGGRITEGGSA